MEGQPRPWLSERQARALEARFHAVYHKALENQFRRALRPEIDAGVAATKVAERFSRCIRAVNTDFEVPTDPVKAAKKLAAAEEILAFLEKEGMGALRRHPFFRRWNYWTLQDMLRAFYREGGGDEASRPVPLDAVGEVADEAEAIEDRLDALGDSGRDFLGRILDLLVEAGHVNRRDADIFLDRCSAWREPGDKEGANPRRLTLREIGEKHDIGTTQVDRIVRRVLERFADPDVQELIIKHLRDGD